MNTNLAYDELVVAADTPFPLDRYLEIERAGKRAFEVGQRLEDNPYRDMNWLIPSDDAHGPVKPMFAWLRGWHLAEEDKRAGWGVRP